MLTELGWNKLHTLMLITIVALTGSLIDSRLDLDEVGQRASAAEQRVDRLETDLASARQHARQAEDRASALAARAEHYADQLVDHRSRQRRVTDYIVNRFDLPPGRARVLAGHLVDAAERARQRYGVTLDATLLTAQMSTESSFRPDARSSAGALGLMQVMPFHVRRFDFLHRQSDLLNPRLNVRAGAFVLAEALARHDDPRAALRAYHGGPRAVESPKQVTRAYVETVMQRWARLS